MTTPVTDLLNGFAGMLAAAIPDFAWRPDGSSYLPDEIPIVKGTERAGISGAQVVLNWVNVSDDIAVPQGAGILQVAVIGAPNDQDSPTDFSYLIGQALHGATSLQFGQALIVQCLRNSSVPMPQDELTRSSVANHFACDVEWPPTINRPA